MKGSSAVIEKPPKKEPARPSLHLAPQPRAAAPVIAPVVSPAVAPPAPKTTVDVMAMHSAYGNAAVARAATSGEMGIAKPKDTPPAQPAPSESAHAPAPVALTPAATPEAKGPAPAAAVPAPAAPATTAPAAGGTAPEGKSPVATAATAKAPAAGSARAKSAEKPGRDSGAAKGEKDAAHAGAAGESGGKGGGKASPHADPAFASVIHKVKMVATHQKTHAPAASKAAAAHSAAVSPSNEVSSRAAAKQTDAMDQQKPKAFNKEGFKKALLDKIKATAPKTLKEADDFKDNNNLGSVKSDLNSEVAQEKTASQGPLAETVAAQPDQTGIDATPNTPLPPADTGAAQNLAATGAAPKPASDADIDLQAGPQEINQQMADSNVTEEQLKDSNEPSFQGALGEKKSVEKESAAAPKAFRKEEKGLLHTAQVEAQTVATKHTLDMHGSRKHAMSAAAAHQAEAKAEEEKQRATIYGSIEKIYQSTKTKVEERLKNLDKEVNDAFDAGATDAQASFENLVAARMSAYKDDRYGGWTGGAKWLKDKFFDLPDEVNAFYVEGHDLYVSKMDAVIDRVAGLVETGLNEAKGLIAAGKAEIQTYLGTLSPQWQATGKKAAGEIQNKFDALEQSVTDKQDQLVDALATKYNDNMKKVNDRIEAMKEENKGLVSKAIGAIKGVIQAIIDLKNMLFDVLSRAAAAIGMIIAHPIKFLGNLVDAGKLGFSNFADHIVEHLKQGFMEWLFGAVASTGITLPKNFDLPGILSLVMQILGLTYANIRSRAVKILGEKVVKALETAAEIFKILITKGPAGLWEYIKDKIGDLKAMVIEKIMAFVMEKVVMAGITWLIGLLNPVGAFIKACKAIYDIVMFFVEHGKEILALVNAIIDSITAIAKGAIGQAAAFVENSLAKSIPVMIGFLASLLGVSGISDKIKEVIDAIRKPINDAIDWVINKAVDLVKAVGGLLGFGKKEEDVAKTNDPEHDAKVTAGLAAIDEEEKKYAPEGEISREDAEKVAVTVKAEHPIFKSITVVAGEGTWDFAYVASDGKHKGDKTKEGGGDPPPLGVATNNKTNRAKALVELDKITKADQVNPALVELEAKGKGSLETYKEGYKVYIADKENKQIQWPLTYLRGRSSRKSGKVGEKNWLALGFPGTSPKAFYVVDSDGTKKQRIPDGVSSGVIADVKDVKYQDFDAQMRDFYTIAKQKDPLTGRPVTVFEADGSTQVKTTRSFGLVYRGETHSEKTKLSGSMESALDIKKDIITDKIEEEG
jgi:hypothetical protein